MKFALVNNERSEPKSKTREICLICNDVCKYGQLNIHH